MLCYQTTDPSQPPRDQKQNSTDTNPKFRRKLASKVLLITWAQNATPVHKGAMGAMRGFCDFRGADLVVIAGRYKNPTSRWTRSQENAETWADEVQPWLYNQRKKLCKGLALLGDVKVQPTAQSPLSGLEGLTHGESTVVGHPRAQMRCVPTPQNALPKVLRTTGAVTVQNYTDSKAGKVGEFHHHLGGIVVEVVGSKFHMRRVSCAQDGTFIDLDVQYNPDGSVEAAPPYPGLICGDAHMRFAEPAVVKATFAPGGLADRLDAEQIVWHDLMDAYSVNPHHKGNALIAIAKQRAGLHDLEREVRDTIDWMIQQARGRPSVVVASNHDNMIARHIINRDWRDDPVNAEFHLETALHMARSAKMEDSGASYIDPFQYWVERLKGDAPVQCLGKNESLQIMGVECGMHGDDGPNGARGSIKNLSRLGTKVMSGHGHSPAEEEGHARVGTMSRLDLEYVSGPSSWMHAHGAVDALGKMHLFLFINGKYTAMEPYSEVKK